MREDVTLCNLSNFVPTLYLNANKAINNKESYFLHRENREHKTSQKLFYLSQKACKSYDLQAFLFLWLFKYELNYKEKGCTSEQTIHNSEHLQFINRRKSYI